MFYTHERLGLSIPKKIQVMRLFYAKQLDDDVFDPRKLDKNSPQWIDSKRNLPDKPGLFYIKVLYNSNSSEIFVGKAFYIGALYRELNECQWYHTTRNDFIYNDAIDFWMEMDKGD